MVRINFENMYEWGDCSLRDKWSKHYKMNDSEKTKIKIVDENSFS